MTSLRTTISMIGLIALLPIGAPAANWVERQNNAPRVFAARQARGERVRQMFQAAGLDYPARSLLIRIFKQEGVLELWGSPGANEPMIHVATYPICASSGVLGPKRRQGDLQVPEGFYEVISFNPTSSYHLSFKINYPNASDRILGRQMHRRDLGGDICIHGDCVTIGCVPIQDEPMEELYLAALDTRIRYGVSPRVHLYPARLDPDTLATLANEDVPERVRRLWRNLAEGYAAFEATRRVPTITVGKDGYYHVRQAGQQ